MDLVEDLRKFVRECAPRGPATRIELIHLCQDLLRICGIHSGSESEEVVRHIHWCRVLAATGFECERNTLLDERGRPRFSEPSERQLLAETCLRDLFFLEEDNGPSARQMFSPEDASFALVLLCEYAVGARAFSASGERELAYFKRFDLNDAGYEVQHLEYDIEVYESILAHVEKVTPRCEYVSSVVRAARVHVSGFWSMHGPMLPRMYCGAFMDARALCDEIVQALRAWELLRTELRDLVQQLKLGVLQMVEGAVHRLPKALMDMFMVINVAAAHATDEEDVVLARENDRDMLVGRLTFAYMATVSKLQDFMAVTIQMEHAQSWSVIAIFFTAHCFKATDSLGVVTRYGSCALAFVEAIDDATQLIGPITPPSSELRIPTKEKLAARKWLRSPEAYLETKRMLRRTLAHLLVALIASVEHAGVVDACKLMNVFLVECVSSHPQILRFKAKRRERKAVEDVLKREKLDKETENEITRAVMEAMNADASASKKTIRDMSPDELCRQLGALELTVVT